MSAAETIVWSSSGSSSVWRLVAGPLGYQQDSYLLLLALQPGDIVQATYRLDINNDVPEYNENNFWSITF